MSHPTLSSQEVARRGKELYQRSIRAKVETQENIGKIISINVETGDYEIGDDLVETSLRLRSKQTDAALWGERIGFDAVYAVGGTYGTVVGLQVFLWFPFEHRCVSEAYRRYRLQ